MRFRVISNSQADLDASGISRSPSLSGLRPAAIPLPVLPLFPARLKRMQPSDDAGACLDAHRPHLPSRASALQASEEIDSTHSRWRC